MERKSQKPLEFISGPEEYLEIWSEIPIRVRNQFTNETWKLPAELRSFSEDEVMVRLYIDSSYSDEIKGRRVVLMKTDDDKNVLTAEWAVITRRFTGGDGKTRVIYSNPLSGERGLVVEENRVMAIGLPISRQEEKAR